LWEAQNLYWTLLGEGPKGPDFDGELLIRIGIRLGFDQESLLRVGRGPARAAPVSP